MTPARFANLHRALSRRQPTLTVLMDHVHKPHNYSAVLRSCDAVGVWEAHHVSREGMVPTFPRTSGSARKWVPVRRHPSIGAAVETLHEAGFTVLAAHFSERAVDFRLVDYTAPTAILLGAELDGVSQEAAELSDGHIVIPMRGMVASLNVSVAAAVILYEAQRQREAAGMYARRHLDDAVFDETLFEWAHPIIARRCREKGVPYPELNVIGDVVGEFPR